MALVGVGLLFKFGAVPFHSWTPDVYAGAPTAVTAFMAACTKIAAIGALMRVFYVALGADRWDWQPMMAIIAVATMAVGSVVAISQTDVKRMLAYSSIAHAGFLMTAFVGASQASSGSPAGGLTSVSSVMFYLVAYGAATLGAFAVITLVRDPSGEATLLSSWVGLGRRSPAAAVVFSVFMLSFAGIPLTSGFIGKWAVFAAAWNGGAEWLVVVAVVISVVAAFFYVRVIVLMFFSEPTDRSGGRDQAGSLHAGGRRCCRGGYCGSGAVPRAAARTGSGGRGVRPLSHNGDVRGGPRWGDSPAADAARRTRIEECCAGRKGAGGRVGGDRPRTSRADRVRAAPGRRGRFADGDGGGATRHRGRWEAVPAAARGAGLAVRAGGRSGRWAPRSTTSSAPPWSSS